MTGSFALAAGLAVLVGISLGLLGGGGSILAVPLLVYVAGLPAKEAIATSLLVVGVTSAVGVLPYARAGRVRWRTGLLFGVAGMAGAYAGGRVAVFVPAGVLLTGFAVMMLATATAMIRGRRPRSPGRRRTSFPSCGSPSTASWSAWSPAWSAPVAASSWCPRWPCSAECRCPSPSAPHWSSSR